ncbi:MAG: aspartate--tRNA ligase [Spirochaetaceae bacterium]|nr:MAG: aspartate--tRNA ligase [Spirochaetaceae bacterium]
MKYMKRTMTCGEPRATDAGNTITFNGWVHRTRDHGGIHFINLRDHYGMLQVVVDQDAPQATKDLAASLRMESCIAVRGTIRLRPENMINQEMATGEIELAAQEIQLLSSCEVLPFMIEDETSTREDLRLEYRYLDLRSFGMQKRIALRNQVSFRVREYLQGQGFMEIETPTMIKSTPEGARDFLVPSRLNPGSFYALPQSPQLYKQLLMVSGFDRYFQLAHCFRDEDARGDRQPEHTQIDMEMSFVERDDVFEVVEGLMGHVFSNTIDVKLPAEFPRISYHDAMNRFGSDKPDLRFDMELQDFQAFVPGSGFGVFEGALEAGGCVKVLVVPGAAEFSRKQITDLEDVAKTYHAKGLAFAKVGQESLEGGIGKFFNDKYSEICTAFKASPGDLLLFVADSWKVATTALGAVRSRLGNQLGLIKPGSFEFAWIVDFPLFDWDEDGQKWEPAHHMFTMPRQEYIESLESDPGAVKGDLYDLVCNGYEMASGSIRVHDPALQQRIFSIVGFPQEEAEKRFGFLLKAFKYGAPPHGGIAPGLDRLLMVMCGAPTIREVIAFPKNTQGVSPMDDCPSPIDAAQLQELGLKFTEKAQADSSAAADTPAAE